MTSHELTVGIFVWVGFLLLYLLRKLPIFNVIWKCTMIFLVVLFGTVLYNSWKEKRK